MKTGKTLSLTVTSSLAPIPPETQADLDLLCELYGRTLQKFQMAFCTHELRQKVWNWRSFRDEIVHCLNLAQPKFDALLEELKAQGNRSQAELSKFLRAQQMSEGPHLQARHWKLCLEEASQGLRTYWQTVKAELKRQWGRFFGRYSNEPQTLIYINWILRESEPQFYMASQGKVPYPQPPKLNPKETDAEEKYRKRLTAFEKLKKDIENVKRYAVAKRVYCAIKKVRRKIRLPHCRLSSNRADFDCSCWRLNSKDQNELRLTSYAEGKKKRQPIALRILGKGALRGTLQLIKKFDVYELRVCRLVLCKEQRSEGEILGFDTGYTEVGALSNGAFVGQKFGEKLTRYSDYCKEKGQKRNKLWAKARELGNSAKEKDRRKAQNIFKHNLGRKKHNAKYRRAQDSIKQEVNKAISSIVNGKGKGLDGVIVKELVIEKLSAHMGKTRSKNWNRRLSSWVRGYIRQCLEQKCKQFGIRLTQVNACHSSRVCPACYYPSKDNRASTDRLKCRNCGYEGHADTCAAKEILRRRSGDIPLYAPPGKVLEMLMVQYQRGLEVPKAPPFSCKTRLYESEVEKKDL
ncbi:zinc ribbon domain-containing protein [Turicimonas muris]|uniref:zinc ribbon domain-containing protein n=5 Tax=Turicimonas muris TaxID=1796652 RepID=UPI0024955814|nr:zinc ribbon domain-containing protein [Turicimonas muris]